MPWELLALALVAAGIFLWVDSLRARESAVAAGRAACARYGVQLLDDTVAFTRLRVARDEHGRVRLRRTYVFEFTGSGNDRRQGAVVLLGARVEDMQMEPYTVQ
jgi:hypothetical protein